MGLQCYLPNSTVGCAITGSIFCVTLFKLSFSCVLTFAISYDRVFIATGLRTRSAMAATLLSRATTAPLPPPEPLITQAPRVLARANWLQPSGCVSEFSSRSTSECVSFSSRVRQCGDLLRERPQEPAASNQPFVDCFCQQDMLNHLVRYIPSIKTMGFKGLWTDL